MVVFSTTDGSNCADGGVGDLVDSSSLFEFRSSRLECIGETGGLLGGNACSLSSAIFLSFAEM